MSEELRLARCPWCGFTDADCWEYGEGDTEVECGNCGKSFIVTVKLEARYTTTPIIPASTAKGVDDVWPKS